MMASYPEQQIGDAPKSAPGNVARLVDRLSKDISTTHGKSIPLKPPKPGTNIRTAHVRFSYAAQQDDELNLEEEDVIEVIEDVEDGWARGKLRDKIGLFPTNFVSFVSTPTTNTTTYSSNLSRVNEESRKKAPKDEQSSSTSSNGKALVEKTSSTGSTVLPSSFKASVRKQGSGSNNGSPNSQNTNKSGPKEYVKVLYDYKAVNPDELDLKEGEIVTVVNRKCVDEGWCLGELNGKRGLFPENFVRISTSSTGTSAAMSTNASTAPPILPAKPLKPVFGKSIPTTQSESPAVTTASTISTAQITTEVNRSSEERKSVIAGIQSKLFPQGKFPPHKPTFQPPSNVLTSSQHSSGRDPDGVPTVQMRHSVVDPTKMGLSSFHIDDQHLSDIGESSDEPKQLQSLTKFRPKQTNKRPPSTQFRASNVIKVETPPTTPPLTPTANAPLSAVETVAVSPSTTSFPAESRSPTQQSPNSTRSQELQSVAREAISIASSVNNVKSTPSPTGQITMGQKASRNNSSSSPQTTFYSGGQTADTDSTESITREFNEFRSEILKRLAKLEERILKLEVMSYESGEKQQHL